MNNDVKKVLKNAQVNSELENKDINDEVLKIMEECLNQKDGSFLFNLYLKTNNIKSDVVDEVETCKESKYCYSNGVLKNNFDFKNLESLHQCDSYSAAFKQSKIVSGLTDYVFGFSVDSYLNLHKKLFDFVYPFAGQIREELIYKRCEPYFNAVTPFCMPMNIYDQLSDFMRKMKKGFFCIKTREDLVKYLGYYYGELNMIHPFREGNGRTLRTYFLLLVKELNKYIDFGPIELDYSLWDEIDKEELVRYTVINSITGEYEGISKCFDKALVEYNKKIKVKKV